MKRFKVLKDLILVTIDGKNSSISVVDVKVISHGKKSKRIIKSNVGHCALAQTYLDSLSGLSQKQMAGKFSAMLVTKAKQVIEEAKQNDRIQSLAENKPIC